jgi:hypothetical protein
MRRYLLKYGDRAYSGTTVVEGFESDTHYGVPPTFVGAAMACPKCKSPGVIVANGPHLPYLCMGKEQALSGKLSLCRCDKPSPLYESQLDTFKTLTADEMAAVGFGPNGSPLLYPHDGQLTLRDRRTSRALANIPYRLKAGSCVIASGMADANGCTARVITDDKQSVVIERRFRYSRRGKRQASRNPDRCGRQLDILPGLQVRRAHRANGSAAPYVSHG